MGVFVVVTVTAVQLWGQVGRIAPATGSSVRWGAAWKAGDVVGCARTWLLLLPRLISLVVAVPYISFVSYAAQLILRTARCRSR